MIGDIFLFAISNVILVEVACLQPVDISENFQVQFNGRDKFAYHWHVVAVSPNYNHIIVYRNLSVVTLVKTSEVFIIWIQDR